MNRTDEVKESVTELFMQLCGDPDDRALAAAADAALRELDELLAAAETDH